MKLLTHELLTQTCIPKISRAHENRCTDACCVFRAFPGIFSNAGTPRRALQTTGAPEKFSGRRLDFLGANQVALGSQPVLTRKRASGRRQAGERREKIAGQAGFAEIGAKTVRSFPKQRPTIGTKKTLWDKKTLGQENHWDKKKSFLSKGSRHLFAFRRYPRKPSRSKVHERLRRKSLRSIPVSFPSWPTDAL